MHNSNQRLLRTTHAQYFSNRRISMNIIMMISQLNKQSTSLSLLNSVNLMIFCQLCPYVFFLLYLNIIYLCERPLIGHFLNTYPYIHHHVIRVSSHYTYVDCVCVRAWMCVCPSTVFLLIPCIKLTNVIIIERNSILSPNAYISMHTKSFQLGN